MSQTDSQSQAQESITRTIWWELIQHFTSSFKSAKDYAKDEWRRKERKKISWNDSLFDIMSLMEGWNITASFRFMLRYQIKKNVKMKKRFEHKKYWIMITKAFKSFFFTHFHIKCVARWTKLINNGDVIHCAKPTAVECSSLKNLLPAYIDKYFIFFDINIISIQNKKYQGFKSFTRYHS